MALAAAAATALELLADGLMGAVVAELRFCGGGCIGLTWFWEEEEVVVDAGSVADRWAGFEDGGESGRRGGSVENGIGWVCSLCKACCCAYGFSWSRGFSGGNGCCPGIL